MKDIKIPLKINPKEGNSKLNTTHYIVKAIEQSDDNIKLVLDNFARLNDKIMQGLTGRSRMTCLKTKIIYLDTFCTSKIATDTFENFKKQARNNVTL